MVEGWRDPAEALAGYERWLVGLPLAERTRREYTRWVRLYCGWLRNGIDERAVGADPLGDPRARDYAARDFKRFLKSERRTRGVSPLRTGLLQERRANTSPCQDEGGDVW